VLGQSTQIFKKGTSTQKYINERVFSKARNSRFSFIDIACQNLGTTISQAEIQNLHFSLKKKSVNTGFKEISGPRSSQKPSLKLTLIRNHLLDRSSFDRCGEKKENKGFLSRLETSVPTRNFINFIDRQVGRLSYIQFQMCCPPIPYHHHGMSSLAFQVHRSSHVYSCCL
jgi:hypothetical protein